MSGQTLDADVVLVGGGIGGLASAYALATAGHRVRVLERADDFTEVGAGLQMAPNATRILRGWGMLDEVVAAGVTPERLVFRDAVDGSELTEMLLDGTFLERYGAPYVVIHRSDLLDILHRGCVRAGVELVPGCAVSDVENLVDSVEVSSSTGVHRAEVALAADGLRSTLRGKFSDDEPICSGYVAYRGAFPVSEIDGELDGRAMTEVVVYLGPGCHLVQYPLRGGEMFNTVAVFESPGYHRGEEDWGGPEELEEVFAGACAEVRRGLRSLWRDRRWPMYDRLPIPTWVEGRFALTGDAAHPMLQYLAQGACQAIEDAACLAEQVPGERRGSEIDWTVALKQYEHLRVARTARVQSTARVWGDLWHVDGLPRLIRNELFRERRVDDFKHVDWLYAAS